MTIPTLQNFHDSLEVAVRAKISLCPVDEPELTQNRLDKILEAIAGRSSVDLPLSEELLKDLKGQEQIPDWYIAGLQVYHRTRSMTPVLDGWCEIAEVRKQASILTLWTTIYFWVIVLAAIVSMVVYFKFTAPQIANLRNDILPGERNESDFLSFLFPLCIAVVSVVVLAAVVGYFWRKVKRKRLWVSATSAVALKATRSLMRAGENVEMATEIALRLTSAPSSVRTNISGLGRTDGIAKSINDLTNYFQLEKQRRLLRLKTSNRLILVAVFGGGIALVYSLIMFLPIMQLLEQLFDETVVGG